MYLINAYNIKIQVIYKDCKIIILKYSKLIIVEKLLTSWICCKNNYKWLLCMIMNKYCYINNCIPKCGKIIGISEYWNYLIKLWRLNIPELWWS
jgi:hypothetical protein